MSKKKENHFESVEEEVKFLRKQNAGMRGQISVLQKQVKKYKLLDLEGDVLNEQKSMRIVAIESKAESDKKMYNEEITRLSDLVDTEREKNGNLLAEIGRLKERIREKESEISLHNESPWWRRIRRI